MPVLTALSQKHKGLIDDSVHQPHSSIKLESVSCQYYALSMQYSPEPLLTSSQSQKVGQSENESQGLVQ